MVMYKNITEIKFEDGTVINITEKHAYTFCLTEKKDDNNIIVTSLNVNDIDDIITLSNINSILGFALIESSNEIELYKNFKCALNNYGYYDNLNRKSRAIYKSTLDIIEQKKVNGTYTKEIQQDIDRKMIDDLIKM